MSEPFDPAFFWTREQAIALCVAVEAICPAFGCHVALTGGLLYKEGPRKDCDLVFYRIRGRKSINERGLWKALSKIGIAHKRSYGFCNKAEYFGKTLDVLFPENEEGDY